MPADDERAAPSAEQDDPKEQAPSRNRHNIEHSSVSTPTVDAWLDRGWKIFPCHNIERAHCSCGNLECDAPGKHPRTFNGAKAATSDPVQIAEWIRQWPQANWAVATGRASGIWVLDIDVRQNGEANFKKFVVDNHIEMPRTMAVSTGGGGWHYYFAMPSVDMRNRVNWLAGVDVRGTGGYVLLPGSNHISGGIYELRRDVKPSPAPEHFLDLLKRGSSRPSLIDGWATDDLLKGVGEGRRDDAIFRFACRLRRQLGDNRGAVTVLVLEAARNCTPPFPDDAALVKVEQAFRQDHSDGGDPFAVGGDGFWGRRPLLEALFVNARRRRVSPWGALGGAIQRVLHTIPYSVAYESDFGRASLNGGIITAGATGGGKGQTQSLLDDMLNFESFVPIDFDYIEAGSGEGLVDAFAHVAGANDPSGSPSGSLVWHDQTRAKLVYFDEVGKLAALASRDGATIFEYIKSGVSGEAIGRKLAGGKGVMLPKRQYRLGLTINVQPRAAGSLLSPAQVAGGFPGRFIWFSTEDATIGTTARGRVAPFTLRVPDWSSVHSILALEEMNEAHDRDQISAHMGDRDPMDSHALLARAKVAIALMALDGRTALDIDDWDLSEVVMEHSRATRSRVLAELASESAREELRHARSSARRQVITDDIKRKRDIERIATRLRAFGDEGVPQSGWRKRIRSSERDLYPEALEAMGAVDAEAEKGS